MKVAPNANIVLRSLRIGKGWSQVELAKRMGFKTPQHLANIEYGTNRFTLEIAFLAASALKVDASVFLYDNVKQYVEKERVTE
jgi:transcriptional regulator with XRE-family HTH domain